MENSRLRRVRSATLVLAIVLLPGCASTPRGVPIEARPTPPQPAAPAPGSGEATAPVPVTPAPRVAVSDAASPTERRARLRRIAADTTAAAAAVRACSGRTLLPDQESTFDTARSLLAQTRAALARDELWRAESLARKARQLAGSLYCP